MELPGKYGGLFQRVLSHPSAGAGLPSTKLDGSFMS